MIGVAGRDDVDEMVEFIERHDLGHLVHIVDDDGSLWASYGVSSQPSWLFVNDDGATDLRFGLLGENRLREHFDTLATA